MRYSFTLTILILLFVAGCKVSETALPGNILIGFGDDTLTIYPDRTYEYEQKLSDGRQAGTRVAGIPREIK